MKKIWDIKLFQLKSGRYCVKISSYGRKATKGTGITPSRAYSDATVKMIMKPWLVNDMTDTELNNA